MTQGIDAAAAAAGHPLTVRVAERIRRVVDFVGGWASWLSLPVVIAIVLFAEWLTRTLREKAWVGKALNWSFAAVFMAFAATILLAEGRK